jgi:hypothetical protein
MLAGRALHVRALEVDDQDREARLLPFDVRQHLPSFAPLEENEGAEEES